MLVPVVVEAVALVVCSAAVWLGGRLMRRRGTDVRADAEVEPCPAPRLPRPTDAMRRDRSALLDGADDADETCLHVESIFAPDGACAAVKRSAGTRRAA